MVRQFRVIETRSSSFSVSLQPSSYEVRKASSSATGPQLEAATMDSAVPLNGSRKEQRAHIRTMLEI